MLKNKLLIHRLTLKRSKIWSKRIQITKHTIFRYFRVSAFQKLTSKMKIQKSKKIQMSACEPTVGLVSTRQIYPTALCLVQSLKVISWILNCINRDPKRIVKFKFLVHNFLMLENGKLCWRRFYVSFNMPFFVVLCHFCFKISYL